MNKIIRIFTRLYNAKYITSFDTLFSSIPYCFICPEKYFVVDSSIYAVNELDKYIVIKQYTEKFQVKKYYLLKRVEKDGSVEKR